MNLCLNTFVIQFLDGLRDTYLVTHPIERDSSTNPTKERDKINQPNGDFVIYPPTATVWVEAAKELSRFDPKLVLNSACSAPKIVIQFRVPHLVKVQPE